MEISESGSEHDNSDVEDSHVESKSKSTRQKRKHFEMHDLSSAENSDVASYIKPKSKGKKSKKGKSKESESESSCDESSADSSDSESSSSDHVKKT